MLLAHAPSSMPFARSSPPSKQTIHSLDLLDTKLDWIRHLRSCNRHKRDAHVSAGKTHRVSNGKETRPESRRRSPVTAMRASVGRGSQAEREFPRPPFCAMPPGSRSQPGSVAEGACLADQSDDEHGSTPTSSVMVGFRPTDASRFSSNLPC